MWIILSHSSFSNVHLLANLGFLLLKYYLLGTLQKYPGNVLVPQFNSISLYDLTYSTPQCLPSYHFSMSGTFCSLWWAPFPFPAFYKWTKILLRHKLPPTSFSPSCRHSFYLLMSTGNPFFTLIHYCLYQNLSLPFCLHPLSLDNSVSSSPCWLVP